MYLNCRNGDFHSMVSALVADFSQRWQAHLTYKLGNKNKDRQQQQQQDRKDLGGKDEDDAAAAAALVQDRKKLGELGMRMKLLSGNDSEWGLPKGAGTAAACNKAVICWVSQR